MSSDDPLYSELFYINLVIIDVISLCYELDRVSSLQVDPFRQSQLFVFVIAISLFGRGSCDSMFLLAFGVECVSVV